MVAWFFRKNILIAIFDNNTNKKISFPVLLRKHARGKHFLPKVFSKFMNNDGIIIAILQIRGRLENFSIIIRVWIDILPLVMQILCVVPLHLQFWHYCLPKITGLTSPLQSSLLTLSILLSFCCSQIHAFGFFIVAPVEPKSWFRQAFSLT